MKRLLLAVLLMAGTARAAPPSGLSPVVEEVWRRAERLEAEGEPARARDAYESVFRVTGRPEAALAVARLDVDAGEVDRALTVLFDAPDERDVLVMIATIQLRADRQAAAARTLRRLEGYASEREVVRLRAMSVAHQNPLAAVEWVDAWLGFATNEPLDPADAEEVALLVAGRLREAGENGEAAELLARVRDVVPEVAGAIDDERERAEVKQLAEQLARAGAEPLSGAQRERLAEARAAWENGEAAVAAGMLDAIVVATPRNPEVRGLRARVFDDLGRISEAEIELVHAEALAPLDPRWPTALGELLMAHYAGREDAEAVAAWERALALEPRNGALWLQKARLELGLGSAGSASWRGRAARSLRRVEALDGDGPLGAEATRLLQGLDRSRPRTAALPAGRSCRDEVPPTACETYFIAAAYWKRGLASEGEESGANLASALESAREASALAPAWERPVNLQAHLLRLRGEGSGERSAKDRVSSERLYQKSLELNPNQPAIHVHLGKLREREGDLDAAIQAWSQAVALPGPGGAPAHLFLAEQAMRAYRPWEVRPHVHAYRASGAGDPELDALAGKLESDVAFIERTALAGAAGGIAVVLGVPLLWWWRRRRGTSVQVLLEKDPAAWREVAGIASALRHEVLKHHTSVLPAVADALEAGQPESARWLAERLEAEDGPIARGRRYLRALEELGRRTGVHLDLRRRDPVFGPVVVGLERLARSRAALARGASRIAPELRAIAALLHEGAYPSLGALVQRICVIELDGNEIDEAWASVCGEPAFRDVQLPSFAIQASPEAVHVRVWKDELQLVLVNLLRNALEATIAHGGERLGVRVAIEEDPVTFLERVAVRVVDDAPKRVSTAMIRGRYIERGLGLTVDVISRNGGSIHVEDEAGWEKAVVVRLPMVEVDG